MCISLIKLEFSPGAKKMTWQGVELVLLHETILGLMLYDGCRPRRYGYDKDGDKALATEDKK